MSRFRSLDRREGLERPVPVLGEAQIREEAGHHDALAEVAEAGLRTLAAGQRERELGIAPTRSEGKGKTAAEARIDVRQEMRAVGLAETLDVRRPDELQPLGDVEIGRAHV